jgi:hypothetical protein
MDQAGKPTGIVVAVSRCYPVGEGPLDSHLPNRSVVLEIPSNQGDYVLRGHLCVSFAT